MGRVLRPGAPFVVTFSNRCFPTKAVRGWLATDDEGRAGIVTEYFRRAGGFAPATSALCTPPAPQAIPCTGCGRPDWRQTMIYDPSRPASTALPTRRRLPGTAGARRT